MNKSKSALNFPGETQDATCQLDDSHPASESGEAIGGHLPASKQSRLDSWKEIATYLQREIRTVQRWEKSEGLPIHRHYHQKIGTVFAYVEEIDVWIHSRASLPLRSHCSTRSASIQGSGTAIATGGFAISDSVLTGDAGGMLKPSSNWKKALIPAIIYIDSETLSQEIVPLCAGTRRLTGNGFTSKSIFLLNGVPTHCGKARRRAAGD